MTVILSTIAKQIQEAHKKIKSGVSIQDLIKTLTNETAAIRFNGDGYSQDWIKEAKNRNLYVNDHFTQNIANIKKRGGVLVETGVYTENQLKSKGNISQQIYIKTVGIEAKTLQIMLNKNVIPRLYKLYETVPKQSTSQIILTRSRRIETVLEKLIAETDNLEKETKKSGMTLLQAQKLRSEVARIGNIADEACGYLSECKDLPEMYEILGTL